MPRMTATGTLSARLRTAQERRPDDMIRVSEAPVTPLEEPRQRNGEGTQCSWSVMTGQRCNRAAVVGGTHCRNHMAMMGTPVAKPTKLS